MAERSYLSDLPVNHGETWGELGSAVCEKTGDSGCVRMDESQRFKNLRGEAHQDALAEVSSEIHDSNCGHQCPYHRWAGYGSEEVV